ncbi:MAG: hydrogenase iron-sulfur subunit [Candidatus Bipolaricaulota bacterium]|nr:hydrogenase iron-sulfur subunit [Candidatus Bipolaricaulota bacterium]
MSENSEFEPKIIAFLCKWTTYAAADLCGVSRMPYVSNISIIKVNCTGEVTADMILSSFAKGADGVLIGGCRPGHCRYEGGNLKGANRVYLLKRALREFGFNPDRIREVGIAGAQGLIFQRAVESFTADIRAIGPSKVMSNA